MSEQSVMKADRPSVVCADVDGTVLATDLLYESLLFALKRDIWLVFFLPFWLLRGRAFLKQRLSERCDSLAIDLLPVNPSVISYLRDAAGSGQRVYFASASDARLVERLADQFDFVSGVIGSDGETNFKGTAKARAIHSALGDEEWEYLGDSSADFDVWKEAASVVCVASSRAFSRKVQKAFPGATVLTKEAFTPKVVVRALRVHQWTKNLLIFAPVLLAHQFFNAVAWAQSIGAALAFSLCASGVYLMNDLLDLEADRRHPRKRKRPCASGHFPLLLAIGFAPVLFLAAFVLAGTIKLELMGILGIYLMLSTAYSYRLKALALVDIIMLAILYTVRIVGGGIATGIPVSQWLLGLSMFVFFSLACVKRFSELLVLQKRHEHQSWGRGYSVGDIEQVASFGTASGYIAVLVLALYVSSHEVAVLYASPAVIWMACPLLLYWISRIWLLARRGLVHDDPLVFALQDKVTYAVAMLGAIIFIGAKW
jgi:4-hydroxybenzoate polyprenyltransferase